MEATVAVRVLVIDDEQRIADTLTEILKMHGFEATPLYSGEAALEWVERCRPDIVLSDICMHRVDGVQTAVRIRQLHPECRVILFSASALDGEMQKVIQELGFQFLQRPLHPQELMALVLDARAAR